MKERKVSKFVKPEKVVLKERYFYTDGTNYYSVKTPVDKSLEWTEITEEEFNTVIDALEKLIQE